MGKNELRELRKQAERAIADAERTSTIAGMTAMAKTLMYVGELLADRMEQLAPSTVEIANPDVWGQALMLFRESTEQAEFTAESAPDDTHTHIYDCTDSAICVCGHCQCEHHNHGPEVRGHCHESRHCGCANYKGPRYLSDQWWLTATDA